MAPRSKPAPKRTTTAKKRSKDDKALERFLAVYPPDELRPVANVPVEFDRHPSLKALAQQCGFVSFAAQTLWLCDPAEWQGIAAPWLEPGGARADVVMRTGFGELYVWDGVWFWQVMPHQSARIRLTEHSHWLVGNSLVDEEMSIRTDLPGLMERARKNNPRLTKHEIYNFVPALALGGTEKRSSIERAKLREALSVLYQLAPPKQFGL